MSQPIVVDIDGTMSRADRSIEGCVIDTLHDWTAPVVIATGKAFPYPIALCDFIGIEPLVIAENGGIVATSDTIRTTQRTDSLDEFTSDYHNAGFDFGWEPVNFANRWRETEIAIHPNQPRDRVARFATRHGLELIDSGYAYHVHPPGTNKGTALETLTGLIDHTPSDFVAIGDSENDVPTFRVVTESYAVANADAHAKAAATHVTTAAYADGLLEALGALQ